jgi:hypothetical protein
MGGGGMSRANQRLVGCIEASFAELRQGAGAVDQGSRRASA